MSCFRTQLEPIQMMRRCNGSPCGSASEHFPGMNIFPVLVCRPSRRSARRQRAFDRSGARSFLPPGALWDLPFCPPGCSVARPPMPLPCFPLAFPPARSQYPDICAGHRFYVFLSFGEAPPPPSTQGAEVHSSQRNRLARRPLAPYIGSPLRHGVTLKPGVALKPRVTLKSGVALTLKPGFAIVPWGARGSASALPF